MFHVGLFRPFLSPALASPLSSPGMSLPHSSTCLWCLYLLQALVFSIKYKTHLLTTPHLCPKVIFPGWKFLGHKQIHWASVSYDITYAELTFRKISFKSLFRKKKSLFTLPILIFLYKFLQICIYFIHPLLCPNFYLPFFSIHFLMRVKNSHFCSFFVLFALHCIVSHI